MTEKTIKSDWEMFTQPGCSWCEKAKTLLTEHNQSYVEYNIVSNSEFIKDFLARTKGKNATTVPQIFHRGNYIGGYEALSNYLEGSVNGGFGDGF